MNKKPDNLLTKLNKKIIGIIIGIIVGIIIIVRIVAWHNSPLHNPDSPFYNTDITFGYYSDNTEDDSIPIKRVSLKSTMQVTDNIFALMYKNKDGKSESYKYFKSHPQLQKVSYGYFAREVSGIDKVLTKEGEPNYFKDDEEYEQEDKKWALMLRKDKNANQIYSDWITWINSCRKNQDRFENFTIYPDSYVYVENNNNNPDLENGQHVLVTIGGDKKILKEYNIDMNPLKVKVTGITSDPVQIGKE